MRKMLYAGLFSALLSGCVRNITPIPPTYPFKIQRHYVYVNDQPGDYDVITIDDMLVTGLKREYCYFTKPAENGEYLFIEDKDCDLHSNRVMVLSRDDLIVSVDTRHLDEKVVGMLDYLLRNHKK